jgi:hypothetical protein
MNTDEQKFEEFLREFEPMRPNPLPLVLNPWQECRRMAAAAVLVAAICGSSWLIVRVPRPPRGEHVQPTQMETDYDAQAVRLILSTTLTRTALEDTVRFDSEMNAAAPLTLPRFDRAASSLRELAKE